MCHYSRNQIWCLFGFTFRRAKTDSRYIKLILICLDQRKLILPLEWFTSKYDFNTQIYCSTYFHLNASNITHFTLNSLLTKINFCHRRTKHTLKSVAKKIYFFLICYAAFLCIADNNQNCCWKWCWKNSGWKVNFLINWFLSLNLL